uniref:Protein kinase domain-containing protein n=1 Tax=Chromera velia CCMP2878 TaxID=1169474 RepID=A0A0G4GIE5_9ALVE|eukprot:Cvel_22036.t1-p1 / transcript=Cvel_22036.t1 / gene=Cvel_22036 / organism=Chromera_velia_CCMP2878 / gene_product=SNF1-related protein kinase catalytic subunit alpha, putative / transcript_product=SNF1-related protein kinase catalytic subunit alpha, putative / location=Cvel_scaffold2127:3519-7041(+) / protein_length=387 / sequence_SO=supercontig / SO=protein_coding / is_pseudo=false
MDVEEEFEGGLPWFLAHPWQLRDYTVARPWEPFDPLTGVGCYEFVRHLQQTQATQGSVSLYRDRSVQTEKSGYRPCAVKCAPLADVQEALRVNGGRQPLNDSGVLRYLTFFVECRNVVRWYDCLRDDTNMYLVSEFASEGDLFSCLEWNSRLSETEIKYFMYQILTGVESLHRNRMAHLNLSVENVVRKADGVCLLIDFSRAWRLIPDPANPGQYAKCPTRMENPMSRYQDPAAWTGEPYDAMAADIFSCGAMLLILLVTPWIKTYPWDATQSSTCIRFKYFAQKGIRKLLKKYRMQDRLTGEVVDLMEKMLKINPAERPSAADLKLHPWFTAAPDPMLQALMQADAETLQGALPVTGSETPAAVETFGPAAQEALAAGLAQAASLQ